MPGNDSLKVGQSVQVEVSQGEYAGRYTSRIEDVSRRSFSLAIPTKKGDLISLPMATPVTVSYAVEDTVKGGVIQFEARVIGFAEDPVPCLILSLPNNVERIQKRQDVRLECLMSLKYRIRGITGSLSDWRKAYCSNLSGGGLTLVDHEDLPNGLRLDVELPLPRITIRVIGEIVRKIDYNKDSSTFNYGVRFAVIDEFTRDSIIKYIFERQRELRRKGRL
ncbi:MAG: flagellar brake domain-containing protein [Firmicutes bacterium]|nr:flagellar brake domain-containing protein [Bacillota bacterium]